MQLGEPVERRLAEKLALERGSATYRLLEEDVASLEEQVELGAVLPKEVLETLAKDLSGPEIKALVDGMIDGGLPRRGARLLW